MGIFACGVNWNITLKDNLEEGSKAETGHILKLNSYHPSIYLRITLGRMRVPRNPEAVCWSNKNKKVKK